MPARREIKQTWRECFYCLLATIVRAGYRSLSRTYRMIAVASRIDDELTYARVSGKPPPVTSGYSFVPRL